MAFVIKSPTKEPAKPKAEAVPAINQEAILGEAGTGYEGPAGKGEFECENCAYFDEDTVSCGQKDMMAKSKQPALPNGRRVVHPEGCCEFVKRVGRKDEG